MSFKSSGWRTVYLLLLAGILVSSCIREDFILTDTTVELNFSADTVLFDTVFTSVGSTTQYFAVKNTYKDGIIEIEDISLAGGESSNYRLNIDGIQANHAENIRIQASDSLYIFVEVTVDPVNENLPVLIEDSILFTVNGRTQQVKLLTYGQDYFYIDGQYIPTQTWTSEKPYVIYNSMAVDSAETLTIEEGCQLYFHKHSGLYVLGTLQVNGSVEKPVVFQGDRLESWYDEVPGQWDLVHFLPGSKYNKISNAIIKNSIIGIQVDTFATIEPALVLENTQIRNQTAVGLLAQGSKVTAVNSSFSNCGQYAVVLNIGGQYDFTHCTLSNFYQYGNRVTPTLLINNYYEDVNENIQIRPIESAFFTNCIIYGDKETEIGLDRYENTSGMFNFHFDHCMIKMKEIESVDESRFTDCTNNISPRLTDPFQSDLMPDSISPAINAGLPAAALLVPLDLFGNSRVEDDGPDIGAIERIKDVAPERTKYQK